MLVRKKDKEGFWCDCSFKCDKCGRFTKTSEILLSCNVESYCDDMDVCGRCKERFDNMGYRILTCRSAEGALAMMVEPCTL